eukprot:700063-Prorocentrum_lima.AAC.1
MHYVFQKTSFPFSHAQQVPGSNFHCRRVYRAGSKQAEIAADYMADSSDSENSTDAEELEALREGKRRGWAGEA